MLCRMTKNSVLAGCIVYNFVYMIFLEKTAIYMGNISVVAGVRLWERV